MVILYGIAIVFFISIYVYCTIHWMHTIRNSMNLPYRSKVIHSICVWLIPFLWYYLFRGFIESKYEVMTKHTRDELDKKRGGFTESNKGIYG